jgi:hypothetical protein
VPRIFELDIDGKGEESIKTLLDQLKGVLVASWAFVGIPWCVPACLGLVKALKLRGLERLAEGRTMYVLYSIFPKEFPSISSNKPRGQISLRIPKLKESDYWTKLITGFKMLK